MPKITYDDTGRPTTVHPLRRAERGNRCALSRADAIRLRAIMIRRLSWSSRLAIVWVVAYCIPWIWIRILSPVFPGLASTITALARDSLLFIVGVIVLGMALSWLLLPIWNQSLTGQVLREIRRCPACRGPLDRPDEGDRFHRCRNCRAAWKVTDPIEEGVTEGWIIRRSHMLDHRGTIVSILMPSPFRVPGDPPPGFTMEAFRQFERAVARRDLGVGLARGAAWVGLLLVLPIPVIWMIVEFARVGLSINRAVFFSGIILLIITSIVLAFRFVGSDPSRMAKALLEDGRCASCGYPIRDMAPAQDGCRVCPECASCWRIGSPSVDESEDCHSSSTRTSPPHTTTSTGFPPNS